MKILTEQCVDIFIDGFSGMEATDECVHAHISVNRSSTHSELLGLSQQAAMNYWYFTD